MPLWLYKSQKIMRRRRKWLLAERGRGIFIACAGSHFSMATFSINTKVLPNVPSIRQHLPRKQVRRV